MVIKKHTRGGEVQKIGSLLDKYKKILRAPQGSVIKTFCSVVEKETGVVLRQSEVSYTVSTKTVSVTVSGPKKNEILLNKHKILDLLQKEIGVVGAPEHIV